MYPFEMQITNALFYRVRFFLSLFCLSKIVCLWLENEFILSFDKQNMAKKKWWFVMMRCILMKCMLFIHYTSKDTETEETKEKLCIILIAKYSIKVIYNQSRPNISSSRIYMRAEVKKNRTELRQHCMNADL